MAANNTVLRENIPSLATSDTNPKLIFFPSQQGLISHLTSSVKSLSKSSSRLFCISKPQPQPINCFALALEVISCCCTIPIQARTLGDYIAYQPVRKSLFTSALGTLPHKFEVYLKLLMSMLRSASWQIFVKTL